MYLVVDAGGFRQAQPFLFQLVDHVGNEVVDDQIHGVLPQFESAHDVVRNDLHDEAGVTREPFEIVAERTHLQTIVDRGTTRTGTVRYRPDGSAGLCWRRGNEY